MKALHFRPLPFLFAAIFFTIALNPCDGSELEEMVAQDSKVEKLADGFGFGEGPAWHEDEQALYFSDLKNKTIHRWSDKEGLSRIRRGETTFANGIGIDDNGRLVFCEVGNCRVLRSMPDGKEQVVAEKTSEGELIGQPNDVWIAPSGGIYFTVPDKSKKIPRLVREGRVMGTVFYVSPDGKNVMDVGKTIGIKNPNGVVGSADGKRIYFTDAGKCRTAEIKDDGTLDKAKIAAPKGSDGLTVDEKGNLYTTSKAGVEIFAPDATRIGLIPVPESPANLTFGGREGKTLYITARTGLYSIRMKVKGG